MPLYEPVFSKVLKDADRINFGQLKEDVKTKLRKKGHTDGVIGLVDFHAYDIVIRMMGEGKVATMCNDEKCNEIFGNPEIIPICNNCVVYPLRKIRGFKRNPKTGGFVFNWQENAPVPYDLK